MAAKKKTSFEERLRAAEGLVAQIEAGGLPLADMLSAYEQAQQSLNALEAELADARQRLAVLRQGPDGADTEEPLEDSDEDA